MIPGITDITRFACQSWGSTKLRLINRGSSCYSTVVLSQLPRILNSKVWVYRRTDHPGRFSSCRELFQSLWFFWGVVNGWRSETPTSKPSNAWFFAMAWLTISPGKMCKVHVGSHHGWKSCTQQVQKRQQFSSSIHLCCSNLFDVFQKRTIWWISVGGFSSTWFKSLGKQRAARRINEF